MLAFFIGYSLWSVISGIILQVCLHEQLLHCGNEAMLV